ncbi:MAG: hypothetical protein M3R15_02100 [Acidobacteriota bacterium]|nr:hypothetical protein [Acidobacteriota bacterium]
MHDYYEVLCLVPSGTLDNSPAIYCWESGKTVFQSRQGRLTMRDGSTVQSSLTGLKTHIA